MRANIPKGMGGGPQNMQAMIRQAQKMQEDMAALQEELGLEIRDDVPIVSMVTRLVSHKGLELVECVIHEMMKLDIQLVVLGSGDYQYEDGMLLKGDINITDSTMLYRIKEETDIDTTIFWEDTRILTTIQSKT